jgi:hypothetical protein
MACASVQNQTQQMGYGHMYAVAETWKQTFDTQNGKVSMSNQVTVRPTNDDKPDSIVDSPDEMLGDPELMEKQRPAAPLALVMGAYPIILIIMLITLAAYFVMSRQGTSNIETGTTPATEVPVESSLPDLNR